MTYNMLIGTLNPTHSLTHSLPVSARSSDIQTLRHGVSLSAWYRPWILLGGLQARVRDLFSPATARGLQYRRCGSCHTPVFTWRPSIPGRRSSSVERATGQCHLCTIFVHFSGDFWRHFFSSDNCVNNTNYCVVVLKCLALSTTLILANWTELNWTTTKGQYITVYKFKTAELAITYSSVETIKTNQIDDILTGQLFISQI